MASVNINSFSLSIQNKKRSLSSLGQAIERLSTGSRINSAKEDAAGQAISNRLTANIRGLTQASRNANDDISLSQTVLGALDEINSRLQRIRELTVQGLNETYRGATGDSIQAEININLKEIDGLNTSASFNGISLLDGQGGITSLQIDGNDNK